jgi:hypothetical protein
VTEALAREGLFRTKDNVGDALPWPPSPLVVLSGSLSQLRETLADIYGFGYYSLKHSPRLAGTAATPTPLQGRLAALRGGRVTGSTRAPGAAPPARPLHTRARGGPPARAGPGSRRKAGPAGAHARPGDTRGK